MGVETGGQCPVHTASPSGGHSKGRLMTRLESEGPVPSMLQILSQLFPSWGGGNWAILNVLGNPSKLF